jgi:hypothetical protein
MSTTSAAEHESIHRHDRATWGGSIGKVKAIIAQTKHKSWANVSENYASSQAHYAAEILNKALKATNRQQILKEQIQGYVNDLNDAFEKRNSFMLINDQVWDMPYIGQ